MPLRAPTGNRPPYCFAHRARAVPDGRGLVYMQGLARLQDFYLLDLASMETRRLTRLEDPAEMHTIDVTPDGAEIVFDWMKPNSDIVLIELEGSSTVSSTGA